MRLESFSIARTSSRDIPAGVYVGEGYLACQGVSEAAEDCVSAMLVILAVLSSINVEDVLRMETVRGLENHAIRLLDAHPAVDRRPYFKYNVERRGTTLIVKEH